MMRAAGASRTASRRGAATERRRGAWPGCRPSRPRRPGARPAPRPERGPDRLAPRRRSLGPDVVREQRAGRARSWSPPARRLPRRRTGGDPDVDRLGTGVGRDDRVRRPQQRLAEQIRDGRLADPGQAQRAARDVRARAAVAEPRQDLRLPDRAHLARRAGQRDDDPPSGRSTHQPGAVPFAFGSASADGMSQACLRFIAGMSIPRRAQSPRSHASRSASTAGVSPTTSAIASRVRSSGVGPRPPVDTTRSARPGGPRTRPGRPRDRRGGPGSGEPRRRCRSGSGPARPRSCRASRRPSARVPMLSSSAVRRAARLRSTSPRLDRTTAARGTIGPTVARPLRRAGATTRGRRSSHGTVARTVRQRRR